MTKDAFENGSPNRLAIDPEVCALLGVTRQQLAEMDLMTFATLVFVKGYNVTASAFDARASNGGGLTIVAHKFVAPIAHISS